MDKQIYFNQENYFIIPTFSIELKEILWWDIYLKNFTKDDLAKLPAIADIWNHNLDSVALMSYHTTYFIENDSDNWEILIALDGNWNILGITGWYPIKNLDWYVSLRWHWVFSKYRWTWLAQNMLIWVCSKILNVDPTIKYICETVPPTNLRAKKFFEDLWFLEILGEPTRSLYILDAEMPEWMIPLAADIMTLSNLNKI